MIDIGLRLTNLRYEMKVECLREKLAYAASKAERITGKNLTLPVLSCVLLEAKGSQITIRATNLDLGLEIVVPAKVEVEGKVAIPGALFNSFLSSLYDDKNVTLESQEGNITISTASNTTTLKSFPHEDFPTIPVVDTADRFVLRPKDFIEGLKSVWYSASISSIKPELSSVYIYSDAEHMSFVATDSFRLAEKKVLLTKAKEFVNVLIPFKNVPEIIKVLENYEEEIEVGLDKNQISFEFNGVYLTSRVIDGIFPDYKQIIPKEFVTNVTILKQDLMNTLKISRVFSDQFNQISIKLMPAKNLIELKTRNNDLGESSNVIKATVEGDALEMNFNYKYIIDCFQSIDDSNILLKFSGPNRPLVITGASEQSFTYLVMPMNR